VETPTASATVPVAQCTGSGPPALLEAIRGKLSGVFVAIDSTDGFTLSLEHLIHHLLCHAIDFQSILEHLNHWHSLAALLTESQVELAVPVVSTTHHHRDG